MSAAFHTVAIFQNTQTIINKTHCSMITLFRTKSEFESKVIAAKYSSTNGTIMGVINNKYGAMHYATVY